MSGKPKGSKLLPMYKAKWSMKLRKLKKGLKHVSAVITMIVSCQFGLQAQDGIAGINEANTKVRGYFAVGCNLMYAVGAILGLIGAIRVYQKWVGGHQETGQVAAAWFGSCVFLVIVATVLKSFFGI